MQKLSKGVLFFFTIIGLICFMYNGRTKERKVEECNLDAGHVIVTDPTINYVFTSKNIFNAKGFTIKNAVAGNTVYNITLKNTGITKNPIKWNTAVYVDNKAAGSLVINIYLKGGKEMEGDILEGMKMISGSAKINIFTNGS